MHPVNTKKLIEAGSGRYSDHTSGIRQDLSPDKNGVESGLGGRGRASPLKMPYQDVLVGDLLGAIEEHDIEPLIHSGAGQAWATSIRFALSGTF